MKLKNDFIIDLATGHSRTTKKWRNRHWQWSELLQRCSQTQRTGETAAEYARMTREEQSNVKDVGGFVGGYLSQGLRKNTNVMYRSVATLDIDYGTLNVWDDFQLLCMSKITKTESNSQHGAMQEFIAKDCCVCQR